MLIQYYRESQQEMSVITIRTPQVYRNYLWKQTHTHRWRETDRENESNRVDQKPISWSPHESTKNVSSLSRFLTKLEDRPIVSPNPSCSVASGWWNHNDQHVLLNDQNQNHNDQHVLLLLLQERFQTTTVTTGTTTTTNTLLQQVSSSSLLTWRE